MEGGILQCLSKADRVAGLPDINGYLTGGAVDKKVHPYRFIDWNSVCIGRAASAPDVRRTDRHLLRR